MQRRAIATAFLGLLAAGVVPAQESRPNDADEKARAARRRALERLDEAGALLQKGRYDQAETVLREVLAAAPDASGAWLLLALGLRANAQMVDARVAALSAVDTDEKNAAATIVAAELSAEKDVEAARKLAKRTVDLEPDDLELVTRALAVLARLKAKDEALPLIDKALARRPKEPRLLRAKADLAVDTNDWQAAADAYRQLAAALPKDPLPKLNLAMVLTGLGKDDEAVGVYREILPLDPTNVAARERLVALLKKSKRPAEEIRAEEIQLSRWREVANKSPRPKGPPPVTTPAAPVKR
jgi:tetratricopeptide (TPR) repeat protein